MIGFLRGKIHLKKEGSAMVDVAGVGYQLFVSAATLERLPAVGDEVTLHTHMHVRDDAIQLYGFYHGDEKDLFQKLIAVSNIGPKVALAVLSSLSPATLTAAIVNDDIDMIASVPGIGKKTAQRVVLELKEKLNGLGAVIDNIGKPSFLEAREALVALGYTVSEADKALQGRDNGLSVEERVKKALKNMGGR